MNKQKSIVDPKWDGLFLNVAVLTPSSRACFVPLSSVLVPSLLMLKGTGRWHWGFNWHLLLCACELIPTPSLHVRSGFSFRFQTEVHTRRRENGKRKSRQRQEDGIEHVLSTFPADYEPFKITLASFAMRRLQGSSSTRWDGTSNALG